MFELILLRMTHRSYKRLDYFKSYMAAVVTYNDLTLSVTLFIKKKKLWNVLRNSETFVSLKESPTQFFKFRRIAIILQNCNIQAL